MEFTALGDYNGIDAYKSIHLIEAGLRKASLNQNRYFMSQKERQEIKPINATVDWGVKHAREFYLRFNANKKNILEYVQSHRNEIKFEDRELKFTSEQFIELMPPVKSVQSKTGHLELIAK